MIKKRIVNRQIARDMPHSRIRRVVKSLSLFDGRTVDVFDKEDSPVMDLLKKTSSTMRPFRTGDYVHVSDLVGRCVRQVALADKLNRPMPLDRLSHSMGLTFAQGDAIHDYVKSRVADASADSLYGRWSCQCGAVVTEEGLLSEVPKDKCGTCNKVPFRYEEVVIRSEEYGIVGSPDIALHLRRKACLHLVEIKSIAHEQWKELTRPKPDHLVQNLLYWRLMKDKGYSMSRMISFVYATKGFVFKGSPFKEYVVDAEASMSYITDYLEDARNLKQYREGGDLPPRVLCASEGCAMAKKCHVAGECFHE